MKPIIDLIKDEWDQKTMGKLDQHLVRAPYVRLINWKEGAGGDFVFLYELKFTQPNTNYMETKVLHTFEHFLEVGFEHYMDITFINVAPMGCQTGFYLVLINEYRATYIISTLKKILEDILIADTVPLNNSMNCGRAFYHDLQGVKSIAKKLLMAKDHWCEVFSDKT
jgi:S-ribosylhomocysteine lyase